MVLLRDPEPAARLSAGFERRLGLLPDVSDALLDMHCGDGNLVVWVAVQVARAARGGRHAKEGRSDLLPLVAVAASVLTALATIPVGVSALFAEPVVVVVVDGERVVVSGDAELGTTLNELNTLRAPITGSVTVVEPPG